ncbi:MAG TPA: helix-turn-helix transcriptional regulator [Clostridium sp.]|uniref:helix-turn-helix domain-containing protein n=1 Tax=Clostridium sp. TaxID=1506 RepID=UPI002F9297FD
MVQLNHKAERTDRMKTGDKIAKARKNVNLTQDQLAEVLGVTRSMRKAHSFRCGMNSITNKNHI